MSTDLKNDLDALRIDREPERATSRRWLGLVILFLALGATGAGIWWFASRERPIQVEVATVTERVAGSQAAVLNASGYVTARRRATVSSQITGKVVEVNVEEGMAVKQGQVLARLDDETARAALALAEAQAAAVRQSMQENEVRRDEARVTLTRTTRLLKDGVATEAELDKAKAELDSLEARMTALREQIRVAERQIDLERTNLGYTVIRAPFSGIAISKDAQPGEMVSPISAGGGFTRTGICTIVDMRSLEIEVDVNENYIDRVRPGQDVTAVLSAYPEWQIPARVITTIPAADRQKATVLVRIAFAELDPRILPDMGVKVTFLADAEPGQKVAVQPVTLAPKAAIRSESGGTYAYVVTGDTVERRAVGVGGPDGDRVEIQAGLRPGDRVVTGPPEAFVDGVKVVVK
jgi:RND family efflux transporter MFP subunit